MVTEKGFLSRSLSCRRRFLGNAGAATLALTSAPALADTVVKLLLPGGPDERTMTTAFPQKGALILQRTRPPLLETPLEVFDQSVFTPNDRFFVRWHWAVIPTEVKCRYLPVDGARACQVAPCRCRSMTSSPCRGWNWSRSINVLATRAATSSRASPVASGRNGAMGNARWTGVRLKDVLDRAGVKAGAVQVRFNGMDEPVVEDAPDFMKSLDD